MSLNTCFSPEWILQTRRVAFSEESRYHCAIKVKLYPIWYKQVTLEWSVPASYGECVFNVYFSQSETDSFEKLNSTPITGSFFKDTTTREYAKTRRGYYIVEAQLLDKNDLLLRSDPTTWNTAQTDWVGLRSQEIQRRESLLLAKFTGIKSYLFRKKSYGKRCPLCYNTTLEEVTNDHCPNCLGTSFDGGYLEPTLFLAQYETTPNDQQRTYYGLTEPNQIGAWTISIPDIDDMDVIIRTGDWRAYRVDRVTPTELQGNTVRQILALTELSKGDVEFKLVKRHLPEMPSGYVI